MIALTAWFLTLAVVTRLLDAVEVGFVDITGDVLTVEYRAIEVVDLDLAATDRVDQVRQVW